MKKRLIIIMLIVCTVFGSLQGCAVFGGNNTDGTITTTEQTTKKTSSIKDDSYLDIECRQSLNYKNLYVAFEDNYTSLRLSVPKEWTLTKNNSGGFDINHEKTKIGTAASGIITEKNDKELEYKEVYFEGITIQSYIIRRGKNFFRRYIYSYSDAPDIENTITVEINYSEIDSFGNNKLTYAPTLSDIKTNPNLGILKETEMNGADTILILGNTFINTSMIGDILTEILMANNSYGYMGYYVDTASWSYATVGTYTSDYWTMQEIASGYYSVVFICGFYSDSEISNLKYLKEVCDSSGTKLVIFPAHNENNSVISSAKNYYDDVYFLNWKGEIEALISSGVYTYDLCYDDYYKHSTNLAGYVGAHMIYRALFGKIPKDTYMSAISQYEISKLGNYPAAGQVRIMEDELICYFEN